MLSGSRGAKKEGKADQLPAACRMRARSAKVHHGRERAAPLPATTCSSSSAAYHQLRATRRTSSIQYELLQCSRGSRALPSSSRASESDHACFNPSRWRLTTTGRSLSCRSSSLNSTSAMAGEQDGQRAETARERKAIRQLGFEGELDVSRQSKQQSSSKEAAKLVQHRHSSIDAR